MIITNCYNYNDIVAKKPAAIPKIVDKYNNYMGVVYKFDQMINHYPF